MRAVFATALLTVAVAASATGCGGAPAPQPSEATTSAAQTSAGAETTAPSVATSPSGGPPTAPPRQTPSGGDSESPEPPADEPFEDAPEEAPTQAAAGDGLRSLTKAQWQEVRPPECEIDGENAGFRLHVESVTHADVTGDGAPEALVVTACERTSETLNVYDGASPASSPRRLDAPYEGRGNHSDLRVSASGRAVRITASGFSEDAPICCPDVAFAQTLTWNGSRFVAGEAVRRPL